MECCICYDDIKPEEAYKFWECDNHYTCRNCGVSLQNCPMCRSPRGTYVARSYAPIKKKEIRKDWKEEAQRRGLWQNGLNIDDDHNKNDCIIESWNADGRSLLSKREAIRLNKQDIRLSW